MTKYILPIILIGISVALILGFANPLYTDIKEIRVLSASYDEALGNSKALEAERDKLTAKYNTLDPENIDKLEKLMPDNIDNIRTILEIEKVGSMFGMTLNDVKYDTLDTKSGESATEKASQASSAKGSYGVWNMSFSTEGTYESLIRLLGGLESNLRLIDISSIDFSSEGVSGLDPDVPISYKYQFNIKTYWLKN